MACRLCCQGSCPACLPWRPNVSSISSPLTLPSRHLEELMLWSQWPPQLPPLIHGGKHWRAGRSSLQRLRRNHLGRSRQTVEGLISETERLVCLPREEECINNTRCCSVVKNWRTETSPLDLVACKSLGWQKELLWWCDGGEGGLGVVDGQEL